MKILNVIISIIGSSLIFAACADDEGNYDYRQLNTVKIGGLEKKYTVDQYDTLRIDEVKLDFAIEENADLAYEWVLRKRVISTERNCKGYITESPGLYDAWLCVTDLTNDLKYYQEFEVEVETAYSTGLYVLSELAERDCHVVHTTQGQTRCFSDERSI